MPASDHVPPLAYPPPLQARRRTAGYGLYARLGIAREDHAAREAQYRTNFAFFGAPAVAFLLAYGALGIWSVLDAGECVSTRQEQAWPRRVLSAAPSPYDIRSPEHVVAVMRGCLRSPLDTVANESGRRGRLRRGPRCF